MATIVSLAKPGTVTSGLILPAIGGGKTDIAGVAQGTFRLQAQRWRIVSVNGVMETTGDGDQAAAFEANLLFATKVTVWGHMLAEQSLGFSSLKSTSNNGTWAMKLAMGSARTFSAYVLCEALAVEAAHNSEVVSVTAVFQVTNTNPADMEGTLGSAV